MKTPKLLIVGLLLTAATTGMAKSLVLGLSSGQKAYYLIDENTTPTMKFVDGKVAVSLDNYEISDIKSFYISETDDPNSIIAPESKKELTFRNNMLIIDASCATQPIRIYNVDGTQVKAEIVTAGEWAGVDLSTLRQGAYVAKIGNQELKFVKK